MLKALKEYRIPYIGLKVGNHQYEFTLNASFFESFGSSEIHECDLKALVNMEKKSSMLLFTSSVEGSVKTICDRCSDDLTINIATSQQLLVKFGDHTGHTDDDILVLGTNEHEVDLSQFLFEYAHLALPARHVHDNLAECNQEVLKTLEKYKVETTYNTQWAALKNLNYEDPEDQEFFEEEE